MPRESGITAGNRVAMVGGQIFWEKAKTIKNIVLRLECVDSSCGSKKTLAIKRRERFDKRKG